MLQAVMESQGSLWSMTSVPSWWRSQSSTCRSGSFLSGFVASSVGFSPPQVNGLSLKSAHIVSGYSISHFRKKDVILYFAIWPDLHRFANALFQNVKRTWLIFHLKLMLNLVLFFRHDPWYSRILGRGGLLSFSHGSLQPTKGKVAAPWSYLSVDSTSITTTFSCSLFPGSSWEWASQQWKPEQWKPVLVRNTIVPLQHIIMA